jgi:YHS domain-containing protein
MEETQMRRTAWIVTAAVLLAASSAVCGCAGDEATAPVPATPNAVKHQTMCPVMGEEVNKTLFVDHQGKRVYVCCNTCVEIVKADPEKYIRKMEAEGITLDRTPQAATTDAPNATSQQGRDERK